MILHLASETLVYVAATAYDLGKPNNCISQLNVAIATKLALISVFITNLNVPVSKWAVACVILRFARKRWYRNVILSVVIVATLFHLGWAAFMGVFVHTNWQPLSEDTWQEGDEDQTVDFGVLRFLGFAASLWSSFTDSVLAFIPWHAIWQLEAPTGTKLMLCAGTAFGFLSAATVGAKSSTVVGLNITQFTYNSARFLVWTSAEIAVLITVASIPYYKRAADELVDKYPVASIPRLAPAASGEPRLRDHTARLISIVEKKGNHED
ncbi:hypothetical protein OQA88_7886 [Cercophora sp. LCS_1]